MRCPGTISPGLCLTLFLAGAGALAVSLEEVKPERHPEVEALPVLARVGASGDTVFVLRGRLPAGRVRDIETLVRAVHRDVKRRFLRGTDKSGLRPVDLCLFTTRRAYQRFARAVMNTDEYEQDLGFFVPYRRLLMVSLERGTGALRHELVHALLRDDRGTLPDWLDEGIASLYVSIRQTKAGVVFLPDHRLASFRAARRANRLPGLEKLAASDDRQVYGSDWLAYYSLSRFLLLYLDHRGQLEDFVRELLSRPRRKRLDILEKYVDYPALLTWVDDLWAKRKEILDKPHP